MSKLLGLTFVACFCINIQSISAINCFDCNTLEDCTFPLIPSAVCDTKNGQNQCLTSVLLSNGMKSYKRGCWKGGCQELNANPGPNTKVLYCRTCRQSNCNDDDFPKNS
ncbi:unnamed protein product [Ceutorhynchus assimilis]|uniref:Uncharacterized protein n=1 Tax=Ceutorhynchus assimilis TaxID=467358 RepID=A0A9N9QPS5_9CUCU|nr:unnamed protein product [Ceutorhynchus assimilis]